MEIMPGLGHNPPMDTIPPRPAPAAWLEAMRRSAEELAAGKTVPLGPVLDDLRASADQLEAL
jgi:hypothetical protein